MTQKEVVSKIAKELQMISDISPMDWLTIKPYFEYAFGIGYNEGRLVPHINKKIKHAKNKIQQIKNGKIIAEFEGSYEASVSIGVDSSSIRAVVRGRRKTCAGYEWKLATT